MLILKRPWTRQPQGAVGIDLSSPLARGLKSYWPANDAGSSVKDIVGGFDSAMSAGVTRSFGDNAKTLAFSGTASYLTFGTSERFKPAAFTWSYWVRFTSLANAYTALNTYIKTGGASFSQVLVKSTGKMAVYIQPNASTTASYDGTGVHTLVVNKFFHIVSGWDSADGNCNTYINGVLDATCLTTAGQVFGAEDQPFVFGYDYVTSNRVLTGQARNIAFWNRRLSQPEVKDLYEKEWQLFAPSRRYIPPATAAASTYTLSAATWTNLTATGVTPRVTVTVA